VFRIAPEQALFIGDSWKNDIEGPGKSGIRYIWINAKGAAVPELKPPYLLGTVTNVLDIKPFLLATLPVEPI
jgi:FMN phosphatase YigB (HAD superfamily)